MSSFTLQLHSATKSERIDELSSFVGEDGSGSFGLLPGHTRMMTSLAFGLARFRTHTGRWQYLALPGALLYFLDNALSISTEHYMISDNYEQICAALEQQVVREETEQLAAKKSLHQMEQELLKRLWESSRDRNPLF